MATGRQTSFCKSCGAAILFLATHAGRWIPVDVASVGADDERFDRQAGHVSHFSTCPEADQWRRDAKGG